MNTLAAYDYSAISDRDTDTVCHLRGLDSWTSSSTLPCALQGPYARRIFVEELGASPSSLINGTPKDDFNGGHADPNLTYAHDLIEVSRADSPDDRQREQGTTVEVDAFSPPLGA